MAVRALVFLVLLVAYSAQARHLTQSGVSVTVDGNKLLEQIGSAVNQPSREAFVKDALNKASSANPDYYVAICNLDQNCNDQFSGGPDNGSPAYTSIQFNSILYGVWVFSSGSLDHCGSDGGWINWAFLGGQRSGDGGCHVEWS